MNSQSKGKSIDRIVKMPMLFVRTTLCSLSTLPAGKKATPRMSSTSSHKAAMLSLASAQLILPTFTAPSSIAASLRLQIRANYELCIWDTGHLSLKSFISITLDVFYNQFIKNRMVGKNTHLSVVSFSSSSSYWCFHLAYSYFRSLKVYQDLSEKATFFVPLTSLVFSSSNFPSSWTKKPLFEKH